MLEAVLALSVVIVALASLWVIDRRDERERKERAQLLNRIQDPPLAVAQSVEETTDLSSAPLPPTEEQEEWEHYIEQHLEPAEPEV